jgi:5-methylcytosine-specific restriction protein B
LVNAGAVSPNERPPVYSLEQCAEETGIAESELARWVRAIERKGQAIFYGPPGTGKTFIAEKLAQHLVGGHDGFWELVQFHPAYAYEDFIQGIRPVTQANATLRYELIPGRFLQFCAQARNRQGLCVLIIDEINRANLATVFGELMYLLEYRDQAIPLAGGGAFSIPANVRLLGTMNTADRSIALVDNALRRRFAFIHLQPNYDVLRHYHAEKGVDVSGLIAALNRLNNRIGDPHYYIGHTFFLRPDLDQQLEDIWRMEIEPYLEEYFFDQPDQLDAFRWDRIQQQILS